jgi:hypothetical protein
MGSRQIEHLKSQGKGLARRSSVCKRADGPAPIHAGMSSKTRATLGGPTQGNPPDASSPLPTDHEKQHSAKMLPVPKMAFGMKSDPERGYYDPGLASAVFAEAVLPAKGRS